MKPPPPGVAGENPRPPLELRPSRLIDAPNCGGGVIGCTPLDGVTTRWLLASRVGERFSRPGEPLLPDGDVLPRESSGRLRVFGMLLACFAACCFAFAIKLLFGEGDLFGLGLAPGGELGGWKRIGSPPPALMKASRQVEGTFFGEIKGFGDDSAPLNGDYGLWFGKLSFGSNLTPRLMLVLGMLGEAHCGLNSWPGGDGRRPGETKRPGSPVG